MNTENRMLCLKSAPTDEVRMHTQVDWLAAGPSTWPTMPASQSSTLPIMPASTSTTSHSTDSPLSWSRSTYYKRKLKDHPSGVGTKLLRVQNLPACKICGQPTQGHKKHRKKEFLPSENDVPFERPGQQSVRQLRTIHLCCWQLGVTCTVPCTYCK